MNIRTQITFTAALFALLSAPVMAGDLSIPNSFTAGTPAVAAEVNANFNAVEAEVDDNNARIVTNANDIAANASDINAIQSSIAPKTRYLVLAGGHCVQEFDENINLRNRMFYCDLSDNSALATDAFWSVDVPQGATLLGLQMHSWAQGGTTTCELQRGTNNNGAVLASVSDTIGNWTTTAETTFSHVVDKTTMAYGIRCFTSIPGMVGVVGHIRIRYTY